MFDASPSKDPGTLSLSSSNIYCVCQLLLGRATLKSPLPSLLSYPALNPGTQAFIQITGQIPLPQSCGGLGPICPH